MAPETPELIAQEKFPANDDQMLTMHSARAGLVTGRTCDARWSLVGWSP